VPQVLTELSCATTGICLKEVQGDGCPQHANEKQHRARQKDAYRPGRALLVPASHQSVHLRAAALNVQAQLVAVSCAKAA
jgi:hypothetical protein